MLNPLRWLRNRRADKAARAGMTPAQLAVVDAFDLPPRFFTGAGTYENAQAETDRWAEHVLGVCRRAPEGWRCTRGPHDGPCAAWPTRPGVQPVSVSHTLGCNPWSPFGGCAPGCTAPDRRISPLRHDDRWLP